jgi:alpha-tubulin suppressor-like RCC1 family protein
MYTRSTRPHTTLDPVLLLTLVLVTLFGSGCGDHSARATTEPPPSAANAEVSNELLLAAGLGTPVINGGFHACAILEGGAVKCWGDNSLGQLGLGDTNPHGDSVAEMGNGLPTVSLGAGRTAKALTAGWAHTCAILDTDEIKCWGYNGDGVLGLGDNNHRGDEPSEMGDSLPAVDLGAGRTAKTVAAGPLHTCAILDTDEIKCWGNNGGAQLGVGDGFDRGDETGEMGDYLPVVNLGTGRTAKSIALGGDPAGVGHTCALLDNNQVKCWGYNAFGQLGQGTSDLRGDDPGEMGNALPPVSLGPNLTVKGLAAGFAHTCAVFDNFQVKCWGRNDFGQLGQGDVTQRGDNPGEMGSSLLPISLGAGKKAKGITAFYHSTCVQLNFVNQVKCWGLNDRGQLGLGDINPRGDNAGEMGDSLPTVNLGTGRTATSVSVGAAHVCAGLDTKRAKCWGFNSNGQLGIGDAANRGDAANEMGDNLPAVDLGSRANKAVAVGAFHACALLNNNQVKCWGYNPNGQLGQGDVVTRGDEPGEMGNSLLPISFSSSGTVTATSIATGAFHNCAILSNNTLKCWGWNDHGQLGLGNTVSRGDNGGEMGGVLPPVNLGTGRTAKAITAGAAHTCAILDNNTVKCWGWNTVGQLGLGDVASRGDNAAEMGDNLPAVNLGTGRTAKAIVAGLLNTCAVLDNDQVKCWGDNFYGNLGLGDVNPRGDGPGEMGNSLPAVALGTGRSAKAVSIGQAHVCVLLDNDQVKCWGLNINGQLGLGDTNPRGDGPGEMGDSLPIVSLGTGHTAKAVSIAGAHSCALLDTNQLKCWGNGGLLGLGDTHARGDEPDEMSNYLPLVPLGQERSVVSVSAGVVSICALLSTNQIKCWGDNDTGQLGIGDQEARGDVPGEMDEDLPIVDLGSES